MMDLSSLRSLAASGHFPTKSELLDYCKSLTPQQLADLDSLILSDPRPWLPLPGPQTKAYLCTADHLYYGGAAGGGKTDLLLGVAATEGWNSIIFRREFPQLRAIEQRIKGLFEPKHARYNKNEHMAYFKSGRTLELGSMQHFDDREKYQGRPHDRKMYDEITHFLEGQFRYTVGWLRTVRAGVRTRVLAAGNPPMNADGRWVLTYWAPWIGESHPNPAKPGELRWFIVDDQGKDIEVDGPGTHKYKNDEYEAHSRTFLPSRLRDNPFLNPAYRATLNSLPEPLRSQLLDGDFRAGVEDDEYQLIPTAWVLLAQARWRAQKGAPKHVPMQQIGVDVARGGSDKTVMTPRYGVYFATQHVYPGLQTKDGPAVATLVIKNSPGLCVVGLDVVGIGSSPLDFLRAAGRRVLAISGAAGSTGTDKSGMLQFKNLRAEIHWKLREALDPEGGEDLCIPDDPELLSDLTAARFKVGPQGIQVEEKADIKDRIGRSPDKGESLIYAHAHPSLEGQGLLDWYAEQFRKQAQAEAAKGASK